MVKRRKTKRIKRRNQKGGNILTFVGKALNYSDLNTWPGVTNHGGNHYAYNKLPVDLQTGNMKSEGDSFFKENLMSGGYTYKNNKNSFSSSRIKSSRIKKKIGGLRHNSNEWIRDHDNIENKLSIFKGNADIVQDLNSIIKHPIDSGNHSYNDSMSKTNYNEKSSNIMAAGYKKNKKFSTCKRSISNRKKYKGGNFPLLRDLRTGSQVVQNSLANTQNILEGKSTFVSPLAWKDQYI